ncbi:MAG TPA: ATP-binding protein, partial [Terriglobales bacterium]|nr:ATP-binding protein [Terriglobales bacterium]
SFRLAGLALRPVHRLASLARTISERDLHQRVDGGVPDDELGELVRTFNGMLARLETGFEAQRTFTADASHELRAPIAVMRLELERGLSRARAADEYREVLQWVQDDVDHLGRIVEQLLLLTRADAGLLRPALQPVDAEDLLSEAAARWTDTARAKGVAIELDLSAPGPIPADPTLLRRVVYNLLDNAVRHAPAGSVVHLRASRNGGGLDVEVDDQGPGVAPEFRPRLFSRFGRADGARSGTGAGIGLGLALGAAIARAHGGWLELVDRDGPGAAFKLHLPAVPAQAVMP